MTRCREAVTTELAHDLDEPIEAPAFPLLEREAWVRVAVGVDARDGRVRVRGWQEGTSIDPISFAQDLASRGVRTVAYTNIARDGVSTGVDVAAARASRRACRRGSRSATRNTMGRH